MEISSTRTGYAPHAISATAQDEFMRIASSDGPSSGQRAQACQSMLQEVQEILEGLNSMIRDAERAGMSLEELMRDPDMRSYVRSRVDEALIKIEALKSQCGDVLPASEMQKVDELEQRLRRTLREMDGQGGGAFRIDWNAVGQGLADGVSIGLGILGGVLWWLTGGPLRSPGY